MLFSDFDLFMIMKGRMGIVWPDGTRSTLSPGGFALIPPHALVQVQKIGPVLEYWFCHFNFRLIHSATPNRLQSDYAGPAQQVLVPAVFSRTQAPGVERAFRAITKLKIKPYDVPWRFEAALLRLVGELKHFGWRSSLRSSRRETVAPQSHDARLSSVLSRINAEPQRDWAVPELAASVGLSADRLNTISQRITRRSIKQHVIDARFQLAFELLRPGGAERASIKEVSARCGFASQHFFCRQFKRYFKLTPTEFRDGTVIT